MKCYYCQKECMRCDDQNDAYGWQVCKNHPCYSFQWVNEDGTIDSRYIRVLHKGNEYEIHFELEHDRTRIAQVFYDEEMAMGLVDFLKDLTFPTVLNSITPGNAQKKLELILVFS